MCVCLSGGGESTLGGMYMTGGDSTFGGGGGDSTFLLRSALEVKEDTLLGLYCICLRRLYIRRTLYIRGRRQYIWMNIEGQSLYIQRRRLCIRRRSFYIPPAFCSGGGGRDTIELTARARTVETLRPLGYLHDSAFFCWLSA